MVPDVTIVLNVDRSTCHARENCGKELQRIGINVGLVVQLYKYLHSAKKYYFYLRFCLRLFSFSPLNAQILNTTSCLLLPH
jgi:hypothetical protein